MKILIREIKHLVHANDDRSQVLKGSVLKELPVMDNAYLLIEEDRIREIGPMESCPENADIIIGAKGKTVLPCWCDSHTHLVYAGSREQEFVDRVNGLDYEEIAKKGGGILNSAKRLEETPEEELLEQSMRRLNEIKMMGTGAVEIKSGYGLSVEGELKMLRVIKKLKAQTPVTIKTTFLGAHAIPSAFARNRNGYIDLLINEIMPVIREENLADYCDVFCDHGFFSPKETDTILEAAAKLDLKPKIHANELGFSGGVQAGVRNKAISVDHLEHCGNDEIAALLKSDTIPTLLPSTAFFLNLQYAPARQIIDSGLPVALASDYNPGSSPSGSIPFILTLACLKMNMLPEEAINAVTINGACAMEVQDDLGSIAAGKKANVIITKPIPSIAYLPYAFGSNLIDTVIVNGQVQ